MRKRYVIASDIDGTLKHEGYIHFKTLELLEEISRYAIVAVVTGRRRHTYKKEPIKCAHYVALENGCILEDHNDRDWEWEKGIRENYRKEIERIYERLSFVLPKKYFDIKEYIFIVRYFSLDERRSIFHYLNNICPKHIKIRENEGTKTFELLPENRDKGKVIDRISYMTSINVDNFFGIGDGGNDIEMLSRVGHPCTFSSAPSYVKEIVLRRGGYVTPYSSHRGIRDILERIYRKIRRL